MLSSFSYTKIIEMLQSAAYRQGIEVMQVSPAYTSMIGDIKFIKRYGLSKHIAAALCIGRRSKGFSEKLPYNRKVILSFSKSFPLLFHVPVRNRDLDKWKMLKEVYKKYQAAHVEHFRAVKSRSLIYGLRDVVPRNIAGEIPARESLVKLLD